MEQSYNVCRTLLVIGTIMSMLLAADNASAQENEFADRPGVGLVHSAPFAVRAMILAFWLTSIWVLTNPA